MAVVRRPGHTIGSSDAIRTQLTAHTTPWQPPLPMRLSLRCTGKLRQRSLALAALQRPTPPPRRLVEEAQRQAAPTTQLRPPPVRPPPSERQEGRSPQRMAPPRQRQAAPQPHRKVTLAGETAAGWWVYSAHSLLRAA